MVRAGLIVEWTNPSVRFPMTSSLENVPEWHLRAAVEEDRAFVFDVVRLTMREYIDRTWGWDDAWQREHFAAVFDARTLSIIVVEDEDAGVLEVYRNPDALYLANIQILPRFQSRGVGADIIRGLMERARELGVPMTLQVLKVNPDARRLYERLGFVTTGDTATHWKMVAGAAGAEPLRPG
jgi:ribosomal protein S18 acetylase RimI-like enzyme